jgi:hypothetical protein
LSKRILCARAKVVLRESGLIEKDVGAVGLFSDPSTRVEDQYTKAEPLYEKALAIREEALGPERLEYFLSLVRHATMASALLRQIL